MPEQDDVGLTPNAEDKLDAALEEIMGGPLDEEELPAEDSEESEEVEDPEPSEEENTDEPGDVADPSASDPEPSKEADHELDTARHRLQMAGTTTVLLDKMTREEIISEWSNRANYQAEIDRAFRERAELKAQVDGIEATKEGEPSAEELTRTADFEKAKATLTEEIGSEAAEAIMALSKTQSPPAAPSGASDPMVEELWRERMMAELGATDPRLRDRSTFDGVEQTAMKLNAGGFHSELQGLDRARALLKTAASMPLPDAPSEEELKRKQKVSNQIERGSPTRSSKAPKSKPITGKQILDAKINMAMDGASAEEIRAKFGG